MRATKHDPDFKRPKTILEKAKAGRWWRTPLVPAPGRQRQAELCEFEARANSRAAQRNPVSGKEKKAHCKMLQGIYVTCELTYILPQV